MDDKVIDMAISQLATRVASARLDAASPEQKSLMADMLDMVRMLRFFLAERDKQDEL